MPAPTVPALVPARTSSWPRPWPRQRAWMTLAVTGALLLAPRYASADDKAAPTRTASGSSVTDGFRSLGQQISDPKTLDRIKGHEQDFEKNVQGTRDQQRKSHPGELRASDATGMANDPKMGGQGAKAAPRPKAGPANTAKGSPKESAATRAPAAAGQPPKAPPPAADAPAKTPGR